MISFARLRSLSREEAIRSVTHLVLALHSRSGCAQSRIPGIRKTFSAEPRSFSCKEACGWPVRLKRKSLQPMLVSYSPHHGESVQAQTRRICVAAATGSVKVIRSGLSGPIQR